MVILWLCSRNHTLKYSGVMGHHFGNWIWNDSNTCNFSENLTFPPPFFLKLWNRSHPTLPSNDFKRNLEKKSKCSPWLTRSTWSRPYLFLLPHFLASSPLIPFQSNWPYCCSLNASNTSQTHWASALRSCYLELFNTTPLLFFLLSSFP